MRSQAARTSDIRLRYKLSWPLSSSTVLTHGLRLQELSGSPSKTSPTFVPRLLIPRSCLPLAFLDLNGTSRGPQGNRMFSANISSLAAISSSGKHNDGPMVLIAESSFTPCFYAVEQMRPGIYVLCQLCAWVTLNHLEKLKLGSKSPPNFLSLEKAVLTGDKWWHKATIQSEGVRPSTKQYKSWAAEEFQLCLEAPVQQRPLAASPVKSVCETQEEQPLAVSDNMIREKPLQENAHNVDEVLNMIRTQYQEALYISQVRSNPFFAFHSNTDRLRHRWRIMQKDHYLVLARSFKVAILRLVIVVGFRNS